MELDKLQALPNIINRVLASGTLASLVLYGAYNHSIVEDKVASLVDNVNQVEMGGTKVSFSARRLEKLVLPHDDRFVSDRAVEDMTKLNGKLLARLLNVGSLGDLCLFNGRKASMLDDVASDYRLQDLKLVEISDAEDIRVSVAAKKDLDPELGAPIRCYRMKPTDRGFDVRSAIAYMFGAVLSKEGESGGAADPSGAVTAGARNAPEKRDGGVVPAAERWVGLSQENSPPPMN